MEPRVRTMSHSDRTLVESSSREEMGYGWGVLCLNRKPLRRQKELIMRDGTLDR